MTLQQSSQIRLTPQSSDTTLHVAISPVFWVWIYWKAYDISAATGQLSSEAKSKLVKTLEKDLMKVDKTELVDLF